MRLAPLVVALLMLPGVAHATEDLFEPASLGMGGAGRVVPIDTSSIHLNASALGARPQYLVGISYSHGEREGLHRFSSGAADSRTSDAFLGTKYSFRIFEPYLIPEEDLNWFPANATEPIIDKRTYHQWDIAGGYSFGQRKFNLGGAIRIVQKEMALREDRTLFSVDVGVTAVPVEFLLFAVSAQNLVPTRDRRYPTRLSAGVGLDLGQSQNAPFGVQAEFDVVFDFTSAELPTTDIHAGVALKLFILALRAGFYSDRAFLDNHVTWGIGFVTERFKLNFGMAIEAGPMEKRLRPDFDAEIQRIVFSLGVDLSF